MNETPRIDNIRVLPGFDADDHDEVRQLLGNLEGRLSRWEPDAISGEISVKERSTASQRVTFELWIAAEGRTRFVGTSSQRKLQSAVREARDDVRRQVERFVDRTNSRERRG